MRTVLIPILLVAACGVEPVAEPPGAARVNMIEDYGDYPMAREVANGALTFEVREENGWVEAGRLEFDEFFREKSVRLERVARELRVVRHGGNAAHIDAIRLGWRRTDDPVLGRRDFDVVAVPEGGLELSFDGPGDAEVTLTARVEGHDVCTNPFRFPVGDDYFTYVLDSVRGGLEVDGCLDEVAGELPFFRDYALAQTGHPSNDVHGWVRNDDDHLYVAIDFTGDNTTDGDADYARVLVSTDRGSQTFTVTASESTWGVPGFTYTERVPYRHKVYELAIPLERIGRPEVVQLAFVVYGTCADCGCDDPEVEDLAGDCCLPEDIDTDGYCCMAGDIVDPSGVCCPVADTDSGGNCCPWGATAGVCNDPPPTWGAIYDQTILYYSDSRFGEHVTRIGETGGDPTWYAAVGWSGFGNGLNVDAAVLRAVGLDGDRRYLPTYDDYVNFVPSRAYAINDRGETVGWRTNSAGHKQAMAIFDIAGNGWPHDPDVPNMFSHGPNSYYPNLFSMTELQVGAASHSWAIDINNQTPPQIAGTAWGTTSIYAFLHQGTGYQALPHLSADGYSEAAALNEAGVVVGFSRWPTVEYYPCDDGEGGTETCERHRDVPHPVFWEGGSIHDLGVQCPMCGAEAHNINDNGWIVGLTSVPGHRGRYNFVYIPGGETPPAGMETGMNILGLAPASVVNESIEFYRAIDINNHNQIVGGIEGVAFIYLPEPANHLEAGLYALEDLTPITGGGPCDGLSSQIFSHAVEITDSGRIIARGERRCYEPTTQNRYYVYLELSGDAGYPDNPPVRIEDPFIDIPPPEDIEETVEDGDPVNTFTGELVVREEADLDVGRLRFSRFYSTAIEQRIEATTWPLGAGWRHEYMWSLSIDSSGVDPVAVITDPEGREIEFADQGNWVALDPARAGATLTEESSTFVFKSPRRGQMLTFDSTNGALLEIDDQSGYVLTLSYVGTELATVADSFGNTLTLTWNGGRIESVTDGVRSVGFAFDGNDRLQYVTNAAGHVSEYAYDLDGRMTAKTLPELNTHLTHTWSDGRVVAQTDPDGEVRELHYDYQGIVGDTAIVDPLGNTRVHHYNPAAELTGRTDGEGALTSYLYDADGVRFGSVDALGREVIYTRDPASGKTATTRDAYGGQWSWEYTAYDDNGMTGWDRTRTNYPDGTFETYAYDRQPTTTTVTGTDRAGGVHTSVYDQYGRLVSATNQAGGTTDWSYDSAGRLEQVTNSAGQTTQYDYVFSGTDEVRTVTRPNGDQVVRRFDAVGNLLSRELLPAGGEPSRSISYTYDGNGNHISTTDPTGEVTFAYDDQDRLVSFIDPGGGVHQTVYDEAGRIEQVIDANGLVFGYAYDGNERIVGRTDPHGEQWITTYDAVGRTTGHTSPLGNEVGFAYFDDERRKVATDARGNTVETLEDALGRVSQRTDQLGRITCFTYDPRGLLASATLPSASLTTPCDQRSDLAPDQAATASFVWDGAGKISHMVDPNQQIWEFRYDPAGRLQYAEDPLSQITEYQYDIESRLRWVLYPDGGTLEIVYDPYGRVAQRVFSRSGEPDEVLAYTYDAAGNVTGLNSETYGHDANGVLSESNGVGIANDAGGRIETVTVAPGKVIAYTYDLDRLAAIDDWAGGRVTFAYDQDGRLTAITRSNGVTTTYDHDENGQITAIVDGTLGESHLTYSADGRISSIQRDLPALPAPGVSGSTSRTFDAASQIESVTYDARGRVVQDGRRSYTWSPAGRLSRAGDTSFAYDGYGSLVERTAGGVTSTYRWSYAHTVPCPVERTTAGEITYYVCTPRGELVYAIRADETRDWLHFDEAGNTRFLSDDTGAVTAGWAYLPYGEVAASFGGSDHPFTFSGKFGVIQEGDLFHMRKRVYDSRTQRFLSRDPVLVQSHPLLLNPYQYGLGDPIGHVDPLGTTPAWTYTDSTADKAVSSAMDLQSWGGYLGIDPIQSFADSNFEELKAVRKYAPWNKATESRLDQLWKKQKWADRGVKAKKAFNTVAGKAIDLYKFYERSEGILAQTKSCQELALQSHSDIMDAIRAGVKAGMSGEIAERDMKNATANFNAELERCEASGVVEHAIALFEMLEGWATGMLPGGPPVQIAVGKAKSEISQLGFENPFASKSFGDSFFSAAPGLVP